MVGTSGITYDHIEHAFAGYCYGDSTSGQVSAVPMRSSNFAHRVAECTVSVSRRRCTTSG